MLGWKYWRYISGSVQWADGDWALALGGGQARTGDEDLGVIHIKWGVFMVGRAKFSREVFLEKKTGIKIAGLVCLRCQALVWQLRSW